MLLLSVPVAQLRARQFEAGLPHCDSQYSEGPLSNAFTVHPIYYPYFTLTDSYLIFPIRGDYFQAQPTWNPVLQVLPRYPLLQTWPTDLGIVAPRALFVTGLFDALTVTLRVFLHPAPLCHATRFRNCMILVVFWLIQSSHGRQGATHNTVHSKAMTFSAWKWGVYEQTRGCRFR